MEDAVVHSEYGTVANKSTDDFVTSKQYGVQQGLEYRVIHQPFTFVPTCRAAGTLSVFSEVHFHHTSLP